VLTRQKRWVQLDAGAGGELEHKEQLDAGDGEELEHKEQLDAGDGEELEEIRKLLRELSNRVKAVPLRNMIVEEERE
jgi:hypothetical protein